MDGPTQATFYAKNSRMIAINEEDGTIYLDASYNYNDLAPETAIAIGEKLIELGRAVIAKREEAGNAL